jgi:hypothetical protein
LLACRDRSAYRCTPLELHLLFAADKGPHMLSIQCSMPLKKKGGKPHQSLLVASSTVCPQLCHDEAVPDDMYTSSATAKNRARCQTICLQALCHCCAARTLGLCCQDYCCLLTSCFMASTVAALVSRCRLRSSADTARDFSSVCKQVAVIWI